MVVKLTLHRPMNSSLTSETMVGMSTSRQSESWSLLPTQAVAARIKSLEEEQRELVEYQQLEPTWQNYSDHSNNMLRLSDWRV